MGALRRRGPRARRCGRPPPTPTPPPRTPLTRRPSCPACPARPTSRAPRYAARGRRRPAKGVRTPALPRGRPRAPRRRRPRAGGPAHARRRRCRRALRASPCSRQMRCGGLLWLSLLVMGALTCAGQQHCLMVCPAPPGGAVGVSHHTISAGDVTQPCCLADQSAHVGSACRRGLAVALGVPGSRCPSPLCMWLRRFMARRTLTIMVLRLRSATWRRPACSGRCGACPLNRRRPLARRALLRRATAGLPPALGHCMVGECNAGAGQCSCASCCPCARGAARMLMKIQSSGQRTACCGRAVLPALLCASSLCRPQHSGQLHYGEGALPPRKGCSSGGERPPPRKGWPDVARSAAA